MFFLLFATLFANEVKNLEMEIIYFENNKKIIQSHVLTQSGKEVIFTNLDKAGNPQNFSVIANIVDDDEVHIELAKLGKKNKVLQQFSIITFDNLEPAKITQIEGDSIKYLEIRPSILK